MHQLPACVQQASRASHSIGRGRWRQAVVDLGGLLGHVDVDRHVAQAVGQPRDRGRCGGAQRVDRHAGVQQRPAAALQPVVQRQHRIRVGGKAALVLAQRRLREAGALVQHRQHRQADAGVGGARRPAPRLSASGSA
jgi:hypothetical protein